MPRDLPLRLSGAAWMFCCVLPGFAAAQVSLLGIQYRPDQAFPEHDCFWRESQYPGPCSGANPLGASVHVFLKNSGGSPVTVSDVVLAGFSLKEVLVEQEQVVKRHPASIYFANLTQTQLNALLAAGEPVWWKSDPAPIPPGGTAQIVVRLRRVPQLTHVDVQVVHSGGSISTSIPVTPDAPRVAGASFSPDLSKVYLYWRRTPGFAPTSILINGVNVTASTTTVSDASIGVAASVVQLSQPLAPGSFHVVQGVYADNRTATAGLRAWVNDFIHGTWGAKASSDNDYDAARAWIDDATNHSLNALVVQLGSSGLGDYLKTPAGRQYAADRGYGFVIDSIGKWGCETPLMWFIRDEPDAADSRVVNLAEDKKVGSLGMMSVEQGEALRTAYPEAPTTLNIDGTYKPYNWYNYGQVPDVFMTDPYYQVRLREAYWSNPTRIPLYSKATYIYAVAQLAQTSCEPNPLHMVLYSCEYKDTTTGNVFPFPTPESKRIEVYYAMAGGAKGISYWWYLKGTPSNGLGDGGPGAQALWREIGLLGAEIRTAAPLLVRSCPTSMGLQTSPGLWARALLAGSDTFVLLVVNDQYANDPAGCHYTPVNGAAVTVDLPAWMPSPAAFEVTAGGIQDVGSQPVGSDLQLNLGTVNLTRMIVVTANPSLRSTLQQRFDTVVRPRVCTMAPEVCLTSPPGITQHPLPQSICAGGAAVFAVTTGGPGTLSYQWQKNRANLAGGGRYSGATSPTLTIPGLTAEDAGSYRCIVTNSYGSTTSNEALLTVTSCSAGCLQNAGFENGFTGGVGNGWIKFNRVGNVTCADETTERHGGLHSQEIYSHDVDNDGGVYQQFATAPGQPYSISAWIKVYSPQGTGIAEGWFGIDPTGGTDPFAATVNWFSKPYDYWSQKVWTGTAQASFVTVFLRGRSTKAASLNRVGYIWVDDVEVIPGAPGDGVPQPLSATSIRWKWTDLPAETGYRVVDASEANVSSLLPADQAQWDETSLIANTQYARKVKAITGCGESPPSPGQMAWTLSAPPVEGSVSAGVSTTCAGRMLTWTSHLAFGAGGVQYYRYVWDQNPTHIWDGSESQWSSGTITTSPAAPGTWYLHVQSYNAANLSNGSFDYAVETRAYAAPDLDNDCDVDTDDFSLFEACASGPSVPPPSGCGARDFDADGDVDMDDFGQFQRCYSGPGAPPPAACTP